MIFTLLCIKEFVKNFPFVNKNNPTNKAPEEAPTEGPIEKDTKKEDIEGHTEGV